MIIKCNSWEGCKREFKLVEIIGGKEIISTHGDIEYCPYCGIQI